MLNWDEIEKKTEYRQPKTLPKALPKAVQKSEAVLPLRPQNFRNSTNQTRISAEQQKKNQALAIEELSGKDGKIASLARGVGMGVATMGLRPFLPGGNNQAQEEASQRNAIPYKSTPNVQNIRLGYRPQQQEQSNLTYQGIGEFAGSLVGVDPVGLAINKGAKFIGGKMLPKAVNQIPIEIPSQAKNVPLQPRNPDLGINISKEQVFTKNAALPKANKEMGTLGKIYQQTVDNQYAIGKATKGIKQTADKDAKILASNARNARGTAEYAIKEGLTDMEGRKVTDVGLESLLLRPKSEQAAFEDYLLNKHNIARFKQGKAVFGDQINDKMSVKAVADYESQYPQFKGLSEGINDFNGKVIDNWLVKSGLISADLGKLLKQMYPDYVPTFREGGVPGKQFNTKGLTPGQVVKQAVGGNKPIMALTKSYPAVVEKSVKSARKNEVYLGLLDAVEKNPDKMAKWARVVDDTAEKTMKDATLMAQSNDLIQQNGLDAIEQISNKMLEIDSAAGKYYATAMRNGKPVRMEIHKDLFDGLESMNRIGNEGQLDGMAAAVRKYATNPFKALITGYNPIFAVKNIFRDIPTAYIQGTENNPIKFIGNLAKAGKSIAKNDTQYQEFVAMGGRKGGFFDAEKGLRIENIPTKALKAGAEKIGAFNNLTETLPRYGEYLGTLKREGGDYAAKQKGIYNAGEVTVNFGRQGDKTKAVDSIVPYLNPAVQGIDKTIRNLRSPLTYAKGVAAVTAPATALYMLNQSVDKKAYEQLDNRTKDTNYLIPTGNGEFIKIPKSRESGVLFGSLFERLYRLAEGQEDSFKGFGTTARTNFAPMNPFENNILTPATLNLATNKDFADRAIVPGNMTDEGYGDSRSKYLQFDEQSSEIAKWIGEQAKNLPGLEEGLSPKQIDYLIRSYTGIVGQILQPATTKGGSPFENVIKRGFTADPVYNNEIQNTFYEKYDDAKRIKSDMNITGDIPSDHITPEEKRISVYAEASKEMSELRKQEKELTAKGATDASLKQIRQQILDIAEKTPAAAENVYENYKKSYIPELSMMSEKQIKIYKETLKPTGVTPKQYREAYLAQKDSSNNVQKAIALNNAGYAKMYEAFEISENTAMMAEAIKHSGLDSAYSQLYPRLKDGDSETKKRMIDAANPNLQREQLTLLYEAFNVSQAVGKYKRKFND